MVNFGPLTAEIGSVGEFGAPQQITTGFASWLRYFRHLINSIQQRAPHAFAWAAITLSIGPHSSFYSARNARTASAVLGTSIPSVRLSVCPSHAGIVSKLRHVARCSLHRWIAKCV